MNDHASTFGRGVPQSWGMESAGAPPLAQTIKSAANDPELPPVESTGCRLCGGDGWLPVVGVTMAGPRYTGEQRCSECLDARPKVTP